MNIKKCIASLVISVIVLFLYFLISPLLKNAISTLDKTGEPISDSHKVFVDPVETVSKLSSDSEKDARKNADPNLGAVGVSVSNKEIILKSSPNLHDILDQEFRELLDDAIPSITVDFITHDPEAFGQYSRLLNEAHELRSEDSIAEFLDYGLAFLDELKLEEISYDDILFILDFCKQIRSDLKAFELIASPEFMQIAKFKILLAEYTLPRERATRVDHRTTRQEFYHLAELPLKDPVLERERRYLLFLAQVEGIHRFVSENGIYTGPDYYNYNILKEISNLPPIGTDAPIRAQITAAKIDIAANLEYARRNFISSSKYTKGENTITENEETLARYNHTLSQYKEALTMLDTMVENFGDGLSESVKRYIAMLKKRAINDQRRVPWSYTD